MSFDTFLESLDYVPPELERNFTLIEDLDKKIEAIMVRVNECVDSYEKSKILSDRKAIRSETDELFHNLISLSEDKVALADQTYGMIDKNIVKLINLSKGHKINGKADVSEPTTEAIGLQMPFDPNEPKYCVCREASYGDMLACDNRECPIEWFHLACVGLSKAPKGKWYCRDCLIQMKQNNKRKRRRPNRRYW